jgi:large subunit ribosomal protein L22
MNKKNEFGNRANIVRLNGLRMSPRKVRVVVDMIRHQPVFEALTLLEYCNRAAALPVAKMIRSGVANVSKEVQEWNPEDLCVASAWVDEGPTMRRFRPRAMGRSAKINKRTSKVTIVLEPEAREE